MTNCNHNCKNTCNCNCKTSKAYNTSKSAKRAIHRKIRKRILQNLKNGHTSTTKTAFVNVPTTSNTDVENVENSVETVTEN